MDDASETERELAASDTLAATHGAQRSFSSEQLEAGACIGRYFVIRKLGAGAMGVVYAAYDPKLDRKLALKLLARTEATADARERLQREAQALAKLAHPNVVAVYDVDLHAGQLYVAMEFVAGQTMGAWMREEQRPWRAVLDKFIAAGRGLAAAHAAGLVHRDFKPDNVMVGDDGRVRVMDFGLARPQAVLPEIEELSTSLADQLGPRALATSMTRTGALMGTPAYMAPEQFEGRAEAGSDQFGFCVALYEGLYGERPFAAKSLAELLGALGAGQVEPAVRGTKVPTWLRAVVLRGLAPKPEQRWPSMDALLEALDDDPKQRRRRRAGVALTVALVAAAAGGAAWSVQQQAQICTGFEDKLAGVWDADAKSRVAAAFEATDLVYADDSFRGAAQRLDDYTRRWVAAREQACAASRRGEQSEALLDLRMTCLDERLQHVDASVELLEAADEDIVREAVEVVAGLPRLDRCADVGALTAEQPPPEDPALAARVTALDGQLVEAMARARAGKYERALELSTAVADEAEGLDYEPLRARAWLVEGAVQRRAGAYAEAEAALERAYSSAQALTMTAEAAEATRLLVFVVGRKLARHEDGRRWAKHAEPLARAAGTPEARARYFNSLGNLAEAEGDYEDALSHYTRALAIRDEAFGPEDLGRAYLLNNLGNLATAQANYEDARAYHERVLAIRTAALGPDHPDLAYPFINLGAVAAHEGEYDQARELFGRALAIRERALGPDHPDLALTLNNLGGVAFRQGKYAHARAHYERALAIREQALGPDHPKLASSLNNLGAVAVGEGEFDDARAYLERALAISEEALGPDHPKLADLLTNLGEVARATRAHEDARAYFERALAISEAALGPDHPKLADPLTGLGAVAADEGKYEHARDLYERALAISEAALGPDHPELIDPLTRLGDALLALGAPTQALAQLERASSIHDAHEVDPVALASTRFALARALWDAPATAGRDRPRARELAELSAAAFEIAGDKADEDLAKVRVWQAERREQDPP